MPKLIDYFVLSFKASDPDCVWDLLNLDPTDCQSIRSYYGHPNCFYWCGIKVHYGLDNEVIIDLSGKGCRAFESLNPGLDWFSFINFFYPAYLDGSAHIARCDLACDTQELTFEKLKRYTAALKFVCKAKSYTIISGNREEMLLFGAPSSDRRLRIYNKAMEQGIEDSTVVWTRFEFQLRNDCAMSFFLNWRECSGNIGKVFDGMMRDFLRYTFMPNRADDHHQSRLVTCNWWSKFLHHELPLCQLYLPGNDYDLKALESFLVHGCGSSVRTYLLANGGDVQDLISKLTKDSRINRRQQDLLMRAGCDLPFGYGKGGYIFSDI